MTELMNTDSLDFLECAGISLLTLLILRIAAAKQDIGEENWLCDWRDPSLEWECQ